LRKRKVIDMALDEKSGTEGPHFMANADSGTEGPHFAANADSGTEGPHSVKETKKKTDPLPATPPEKAKGAAAGSTAAHPMADGADGSGTEGPH
jgi:hypothetical protein